MIFDPTLYAGTTNGVYQFDAYRKIWQITEDGLADVFITDLVVDSRNGVLYAATLGQGVLRSTDGGLTWDGLDAPESAIAALAVDPQNGLLYAGLFEFNQLFRFLGDEAGWEDFGPVDVVEGVAVTALVIIGTGQAIYVGMTNGFWLYESEGPSWLPIELDEAEEPVEAIALDARNGVLYVGGRNGRVFRSDFNDDEPEALSWDFITDGLPEEYDVTALALDEHNRFLYAGTSGGGAYHYSDEKQVWRFIGLDDGVVRALVWDAERALLYAGLEGGQIFRSADIGQNWQILRDGLPDKAGIQVLTFGVPQSHIAYDALERLRSRDTEIDKRPGSRPYPVRLSLLPQTRLPAFLRTRLPFPLPGDIGDRAESPHIADLLDPVQIQAIFGVYGGQRERLDERLYERLSAEIRPGRILKLTALPSRGGDQIERQLRHLTWHQYHRELPVIGGSIRVHGVIDDDRVAVTNSYFPIPLDYPFSEKPELEEDPLEPRLSFEEGLEIAREAVANKAALLPVPPPVDDPEPVPLPPQSPLDRFFEFIGQLLRRLLGSLFPADNVNALSEPVADAEKLPAAEAVEIIGASPVKIRESDFAILPFGGVYYLVSRFLVTESQSGKWFVEVDMKSGQVVGEPWQPTLHAPYYQNSEQAEDNNPIGDTSALFIEMAIWKAELDETGSLLDLNGDDFSGPDHQNERTTVAAQALILYHHLRENCGVSKEDLREDGVVLAFDLDEAAATGFSYDNPSQPLLEFTLGGDSGIPVGNQIVIAPTKDPEVGLHELAHALLWIFNPESWDTPATLRPFGRALQEGYAMYLSRSVATGDDNDDDDPTNKADWPWAKAAYPSSILVGGDDLGWGNRWLFARDSKEPGADLLLSPRNYPESLYVNASIDVYDVSMVWARAMWDIRQAMGAAWRQADQLAVQAYPYLHGHIVNLEPAVQGLLDAQLHINDVDLTNASQGVWTGRGVMAGHGVHDIAMTESGLLIAAADSGILVYNNSVTEVWQLDNDLAGGGHLTGVIAVAADGETRYAAAQLPTTTTAGDQTQWLPGIYRKDVGDSAWQTLGAWPQGAIPTCLLVVVTEDDGDDVLVVGTDQGVYVWHEQVDEAGNSYWQWLHHTSTENVNILAIEQMETIEMGGTSHIRLRACGSNDLRQHLWTNHSSNTAWSGTLVETLEPIKDASDDGTPRLMAMTVWQGENLVGSLSGLWKITKNWQNTIQVGSVTDPVLALTSHASNFYFATATGVYQGDDVSGVPTSLPAPGTASALPPGVLVISLHVDANNNLIAGTLTHGIWHYNGLNWVQRYQPATASAASGVLFLAEGELIWQSFELDNAQTYEIVNNLSGLEVSLAQVGFPLQVVPAQTSPVSGNPTYSLEPGLVIITLHNNMGHDININLRRDVVNEQITITSTRG